MERHEKERRREISKKNRCEQYKLKFGREMSSDSSDEEDLDPETRKMLKFEELLKHRIFLADRFEKIEKALL